MKCFSKILLATCLMIIFLPARADAASLKERGFCVEEMNKYLPSLGLSDGAFKRAKPGVAMVEETGDKSLMYRRDAADVPTTVAIQKIPGANTTQRLTIRVPSVLFGNKEQKDFYFNDRCEVVSVSIEANGTVAFVNAKLCRNILASDRAAQRRYKGKNPLAASLIKAYPNSGWAKCENVYSDAMVELCKTYEDRFPPVVRDITEQEDASVNESNGVTGAQ